jgi:hypothetical protein
MILQEKGPLPLRATQALVVVSTVLCGVAQLFLDEDHLIYVMGSLLGTAMTFYALRKEVLYTTPISSMILIGYGFSWFFLPLVTTTCEGKSLINNLERPDLIFLHNLILYVALIGAHLIYLKVHHLQGIRRMLSEKVLQPLGFFHAPRPLQFWIMGIVGFVCSLYTAAGSYVSKDAEVGFMEKFLSGFAPYTYAPYLLLAYPLMGKASSSKVGRIITLLILYSVLVCGAGLARNSRAAMVLGFASVGLSLLLGAWLGKISLQGLKPRVIVISAVVGYLVLSQLTTLAKAMVVARGERDKVTPLELVMNTLEIYNDPKALSDYEKIMEKESDWDDIYIDNLFFTRLGNLRWADKTLNAVSRFSPEQFAEVASSEIDKVWCQLPVPILKLLHLEIDKVATQNCSGGDTILIVTGDKNALGGMSTGSLVAILYSIFGWFYPLWMALTAIIVFILVDSYVVNNRSGFSLESEMIFSAVVMISMYPTTFMMTSAATGCEAYSTVLGFIIRGYLQMGLLYMVLYWMTRLVMSKRIAISE